MKKLFTLLLIIFVAKSFGQQWPYKLSATTATYSNLTNGTSLNNGNVWTVDSIFKVPLTNFNFSVDGLSFDTIYVQAARGILFDLNYNHFLFGYSTVYGGTTGSILVDKGGLSSLSPISYQFSGQVGSQVLTLEFKNAGYHPFFCTDTNTFVNYQIGLFEADDHIEIHYGPSLLQGVFPNFLPFVSFHCYGDTGFYICSNPSNPSAYWVDMTQPNYSPLSSSPTNGTLFKIELDSLFSPAAIQESSFSKTNIYPNPGNNKLYIRNLSEFKTYSVSFSNAEGRLVFSKTIETVANGIDVGALCKGIYFVKISDAKFSRVYKYIKL